MFNSIRKSARKSAVLAASATLVMTSLLAGCKGDPNTRKTKYLESGKRYEAEGKYREAVIQFSNALKVDKNFAAAHYEMAKSYTKMSMPQQAFGELSRTVELDPKNVQARVQLGEMYLSARQPDKANEQAQAILAQQPNSADAYSLMASIAASKGDRAAAITNIQKAIEIDPKRSEFHATLGMLQAGDGGNAADAQGNLQRAIDLDSTNTKARFAMASILEKKGDLPGAQAQLEAAIKSSPKDLQARAALAGLYLRQNNKQAAENTIRQATEDFSEDMEGAGMLERYLARSGQDARAEGEYAALVQKHPKSFPLRIAYSRVLMAHGRFDKAGEVAKDLTKTNPNDPEVAVLNASLLMQQGKNDQAFTMLQQAAKNNPDDAQVKVLLGLSARAKGDLTLAETSFRDAAQRDPSNLNAQRGLAEMANRKNDGAELRQVANTTMKVFPGLAEPYLWRGTADANDNRLDTAEQDFKTALKLDPKNAQALAELGQLKMKQGKAAEGKGYLEQAVQLDPNSSAMPLLVRLDLQGNQPQAAIARIQQQLNRTPNNASLYDQLAAVQLMTKNPGPAMESSRKALQLNPADQLAMRNFTQAALQSNQPQQAQDMWTKWAGAHPQDSQAPAFLGMLAESAGEGGKAMEFYQKSLQLKPDQPGIQNNLAFLMTENGQNLDVALTMAQNAHRGMPDSPNTADTLAWVYYKKGVYSSARDLLEDAERKDPNNASVQYHLGATYLKLNMKPEAATHLKKAATLAPDSKAGKSAAQELGQAS